MWCPGQHGPVLLPPRPLPPGCGGSGVGFGVTCFAGNKGRIVPARENGHRLCGTENCPPPAPHSPAAGAEVASGSWAGGPGGGRSALPACSCCPRGAWGSVLSLSASLCPRPLLFTGTHPCPPSPALGLGLLAGGGGLCPAFSTAPCAPGSAGCSAPASPPPSGSTTPTGGDASVRVPLPPHGTPHCPETLRRHPGSGATCRHSVHWAQG